MYRKTLLTALVLLAASFGNAAVQAQSIDTYTRNNPKFLATFQKIAAEARRSTVRVHCNGKETALGIIVGADGWILTKAHDLDGSISCQLPQGGIYQAVLVGVHAEHDLALLKIEVRNLAPAKLKDSRALPAGAWLISPSEGESLAAVGVVSVATRTLPANGQGSMFVNSNAGYLGVALEEDKEGVRVIEVVSKSGAANAGLRAEDLIKVVNGRRVMSPEDVLRALNRSKPGDSVSIQFRRGDMDLEKFATLGKRPASNRAEFQNNLGGALSNRRSGYSIILQHDSVLQPTDCGGPLVDLDGGVVGINISRVGRTETWAVPAEVVNPLLAELMSGRLAPKADTRRTTEEQ